MHENFFVSKQYYKIIGSKELFKITNYVRKQAVLLKSVTTRKEIK